MMRVEPWRKELWRSFALAQPAKAKEILKAIEHGASVDYVGDRSVAAAEAVDRELLRQRRGKLRPPPPMDPLIRDAISAVIAEDVATKKKAGPYKEKPFPNLFISPIGGVPKKNGKVRVIHNLSHPFKGASVNASVEEVPFRLQSFSNACDAVMRLAKGRRGRRDIWLIKLDVLAAYKQVAVRPEDWHLLGFKWLDEYYYERVLPFGLRSSCRLWDIFAEALHYFFEKHLGIDVVIHYVDDFLFVVEGLPRAQDFLRRAERLCAKLGVPFAKEKTEGPALDLVFLGLHLDTYKMEASLPPQRLADLRLLVEDWKHRKSATINELQSLQGTLQFACQVMRPARHFLNRLRAFTTEVLRKAGGNPKSPERWLLTPEIQLDLEWWRSKAPDWNGVSLLYDLDWENDSNRITLQTDACEKGYGAVWNGEWFNGAWDAAELACAQRRTKVSMPFMETLTLLYAAATWAHCWKGKRIVFRTDCMVSVDIIGHDKRNSADPQLQVLVRRLCELASEFNFDYRCEHIAGVENVAADALSRFDMDRFRTVCPSAQLPPTPPRRDLVPLPPPRFPAPPSSPSPAQL
jgi:hypothetical protein